MKKKYNSYIYYFILFIIYKYVIILKESTYLILYINIINIYILYIN